MWDLICTRLSVARDEIEISFLPIFPWGVLGLLSPSAKNYQPLKLEQYENPRANLSAHSLNISSIFHIKPRESQRPSPTTFTEQFDSVPIILLRAVL